jgi:hypothetical protein
MDGAGTSSSGGAEGKPHKAYFCLIPLCYYQADGRVHGKTGQPELSDLRDCTEAASGFAQRDPVRAGLVENSRSSG